MMTPTSLHFRVVSPEPFALDSGDPDQMPRSDHILLCMACQCQAGFHIKCLDDGFGCCFQE